MTELIVSSLKKANGAFHSIRIVRYALSCIAAIIVSIMPARAEYTIAAILPLSGQVASLGIYVQKGIQLALSELSAEERGTINVIFEDDQFDPVKTISAYRKLKATGKLDAVLVVGSPPANALGPITERDKTILVAVGASDPTIAVGKEYSFIHWVIPPVLGEKLADELVKRSLKKVAILSNEVSGAIADADAANEAIRRRGIPVVHRQTFLKEVTDFRSALLQIRSKGADAVVVALVPGSVAAFAKQFKDMKIAAELIGMETFEDEGEVKAANGALLGSWYVNAADNSEPFIAAYRKRYQEYPGWGTGNGYDALRLLARAARETDGTGDAVKRFLRQVDGYVGAVGTYGSSGDNRFTLPAAAKEVTAGGFKTIR